MSWESDVTAASSFLGAASNFSTANSKNTATQTEANYQEQNIANNTLRRAGTLQTSYLQSGIALDPNTAVNQVITQAFGQGQTDITRTQNNANAAISNANTAARAAALSGLGSSALKLFGGSTAATPGGNTGDSSFLGSFLKTGDTNALGQSIGGALDPSPVGPYQSPF
jgi:hypothetical protein